MQIELIRGPHSKTHKKRKATDDDVQLLSTVPARPNRLALVRPKNSVLAFFLYAYFTVVII